MKLMKLKVLTASVMLFIGSQPAYLLAQNTTASQPAAPTAAPGQTSNAPAAAPGPASDAPATAPAPQPGYRGGPPPRYYRGYRRDNYRPFGSSGPSFSGPWGRDRRGSGSGFGFGSDSGPGWGSRSGPRWDSGPSFGSRGPRYGGWDDWDRGPSFDAPFMDDPYYDRGRGYYDRGPRFGGPDDWDWGGSGMGMSW